MRKFKSNLIKLRKLPYPERLTLEATIDSKWGPTSSELNEIATITHEPQHQKETCLQIYQRLYKNLTKSSTHAIVILKTLSVFHYLLINGSSQFLHICQSQSSVYTFKSLLNYDKFKHDDSNQQIGVNIRKKAGDLIDLLTDSQKLQLKRLEFQNLRLDMKLPTPRSSLDLPSSPTTMVMGPNGSRLTRSLDINRADFNNSFFGPLYSSGSSSSSSSSEEEESLSKKEKEKIKLSNIAEEELVDVATLNEISRTTTMNSNLENENPVDALLTPTSATFKKTTVVVPGSGNGSGYGYGNGYGSGYGYGSNAGYGSGLSNGNNSKHVLRRYASTNSTHHLHNSHLHLHSHGNVHGNASGNANYTPLSYSTYNSNKNYDGAFDGGSDNRYHVRELNRSSSVPLSRLNNNNNNNGNGNGNGNGNYGGYSSGTGISAAAIASADPFRNC
ncbi:unnamed protein product [Ambrosiozyma monospora]|uniref:Unnamed protein product n=1 Tax=Ambrosiozyma monospora TaxID=43982 RepID=A0A9W6Z2W1_AMBMO|nr:unnamed protein product [Ambrosiozyma monospora]